MNKTVLDFIVDQFLSINFCSQVWQVKSFTSNKKNVILSKPFKQHFINISVLYTSINSLRPSDAYGCVSKLTIIGSDNGLSPRRHQAIIWINAGILKLDPWEQISVKFQSQLKHFHLENALENVVCEMASILSRPQCVNTCIHVYVDGNKMVTCQVSAARKI